MIKVVNKAKHFLKRGEGAKEGGGKSIQDKQRELNLKARGLIPDDDEEGALLISHGGTWNTLRKFVNTCEAKELEKVMNNREFRDDPMAKTRYVNKKRMDIGYRAKNWEPWG